eukprot:scaffold11958_cov72-Phaeocystis_antarctica.AAC.1
MANLYEQQPKGRYRAQGQPGMEIYPWLVHASAGTRVLRTRADWPSRFGEQPERARAYQEAARCPTCCAQPARREQREDRAGSGDAEEDEGAGAPGGFLRLVVEMGESIPVWLRGGIRELRRARR